MGHGRRQAQAGVRVHAQGGRSQRAQRLTAERDRDEGARFLTTERRYKHGEEENQNIFCDVGLELEAVI